MFWLDSNIRQLKAI